MQRVVHKRSVALKRSAQWLLAPQRRFVSRKSTASADPAEGDEEQLETLHRRRRGHVRKDSVTPQMLKGSHLCLFLCSGCIVFHPLVVCVAIGRAS